MGNPRIDEVNQSRDAFSRPAHADRLRPPRLTHRSRVACVHCRARKVRCDIMRRDDDRCTNCKIDQKVCTITTRRQFKHPFNSKQVVEGRKVWQANPHYCRLCIADMPAKTLLIPPKPDHVSDAVYENLISGGTNIFSIHGNEVIAAVLAAYIDHVHPFMPFLDLSLAEARVVDEIDSGRMSLLVLHSVLAAGWLHTSETVFLAAGFSSAIQASRESLEKAKMLYSQKWDNDPITVTKAMLLIQYTEPTARVGDGDIGLEYFREQLQDILASGKATDGSDAPLMELPGARSWRRLWWSCYVRDRTLGLLTGQSIYDLTDYPRIPIVSLDDFKFQQASKLERQAIPVLSQDPLAQISAAMLFKFQVELFLLLESITKPSFEAFGELTTRMQRWRFHFTKGRAATTPGASHCLDIQWENLRLLQSTVALLLWLRVWQTPVHSCSVVDASSLELRKRHQQLQACSLHVKRLADALMAFHSNEKLPSIPHGGLWAVLPALVVMTRLLRMTRASLAPDLLKRIHFFQWLTHAYRHYRGTAQKPCNPDGSPAAGGDTLLTLEGLTGYIQSEVYRQSAVIDEEASGAKHAPFSEDIHRTKSFDWLGEHHAAQPPKEVETVSLPTNGQDLEKSPVVYKQADNRGSLASTDDHEEIEREFMEFLKPDSISKGEMPHDHDTLEWLEEIS